MCRRCRSLNVNLGSIHNGLMARETDVQPIIFVLAVISTKMGLDKKFSSRFCAVLVNMTLNTLNVSRTRNRSLNDIVNGFTEGTTYRQRDGLKTVRFYTVSGLRYFISTKLIARAVLRWRGERDKCPRAPKLCRRLFLFFFMFV